MSGGIGVSLSELALLSSCTSPHKIRRQANLMVELCDGGRVIVIGRLFAAICLSLRPSTYTYFLHMLPPSSYSLTENERMIVVQLILLLLCPIVAWHSTIPFQRVSRHLIGAIASTTTNYPGCSYDGEVVGSNGEIGSYILHSLNCKGIPEPELPYLP